MKLAHAVVACLAGAGLALYSATRVWSVAVTTRPGLPDLRAETTGAAAQPWLLALAVVALAGAGALLATRGVVRRGLGGLLVAVGAAVAVAAITAWADLPGEGSPAGPIACVGGGALIAVGGLGAGRRGHEWPAMSSRYERRTVPSPARTPGGGSGPSPAAGLSVSAGPPAGEGAPAPGGAPAGDGPPAPDGSGDGDSADGPDDGRAADNRAFWDALDRGDDPTAG